MTLHSMSLPATFTGVAHSLRDDVLPHLADDYARMQVRAIAELMTNLAARTTWDPELVEATAERAEAAAGTGAAPGAPAERLRLAREAVGAVIDGLYTTDSSHAAAVRELVEAEFAAEDELIVTGSLRS